MCFFNGHQCLLNITESSFGATPLAGRIPAFRFRLRSWEAIGAWRTFGQLSVYFRSDQERKKMGICPIHHHLSAVRLSKLPKIIGHPSGCTRVLSPAWMPPRDAVAGAPSTPAPPAYLPGCLNKFGRLLSPPVQRIARSAQRAEALTRPCRLC